MKLIMLIISVLSFDSTIYCQDSLNVLSLKDENYSLSLDFQDNLCRIDSLNTVEGTIYFVTFPTDSSYIRLNYILASSIFECCDKADIYKETENCKKNGITDRRGNIIGSKLFWRAITDDQIQIIYNNCPSEKIEYFDRIMNSVTEQISNR